MFSAIGRSIDLFKVCLQVLSADKELVFFPIMSLLGVGAVMLTFAGVGFGIGALDRLIEGNQGIGDIAVAIAFYFFAYFVIIFFNSALVFAANERLTGGDPTVRSGLRGAYNRIITIFIWAIVAATVGLILQMLSSLARERGGVSSLFARATVALLGAAWTALTFFVVPLIVIERRKFGDAFKTSVSMIRSTWGDQVVANFGLGIVSFLALLLCVGVAALIFFILSPLLGDAALIVALAVGIPLIAAVSLLFATLDGIYKAALYNYAVNGTVPRSFIFSADPIRNAFRQR